jgi:predicted  nucleic acid-binding Zn-ribbon protein
MLSQLTHEQLSGFVKHLDELEKHNNDIYNQFVKEINKHFDQSKPQERLDILKILIDSKKQQIDYHIDDLSKIHPNLEKHVNSLIKLKNSLDELEKRIQSNEEKIISNKKEYMKYINIMKEMDKKRFGILKDAIKETHKKKYLS